MATVTMNTEAAIVLITQYCVKGHYDCIDDLHNCPEVCGTITYIDENGIEQTISGLCQDSLVKTFYAQEIIEHIGITFLDCSLQ